MMIRIGRFSIALRIHSGFFAIEGRHRADIDRPNYHMFVQDLSAGVLPYSTTRGRSGEAVVELVGNSASLQAAQEKLIAISAGRRSRGDRLDPEELVRHVGERLPWTGRFLVDLRRADADPGQHFGAAECYDRWTPRIGGYTFQFAFRRAGRGAFEVHVGMVQTSRLFEVRIPEALGGVRGYSRVLRRLDRFYELGPKHWTRQLERGGADWQFDLTGYRRAARVYRERASRDWGWSGRDSTSEFKTEFFTVFRYLKMRRACALVRQSIVESLCNVLRRSGIDARVAVSGLPTAADVELAIAKLERGEISLEDAYNIVSQ